MSHINTYTQKVSNVDLFLDVCENWGYEVIRGKQTVQQFGSNRVDCIGSVKITGWRYPIAITDQGELKYDHFGSQPDTMKLLGLVMQDYNIEVLNQSIPYDEIKTSYQKTLENGDIQFVLEY